MAETHSRDILYSMGPSDLGIRIGQRYMNGCANKDRQRTVAF